MAPPKGGVEKRKGAAKGAGDVPGEPRAPRQRRTPASPLPAAEARWRPSRGRSATVGPCTSSLPPPGAPPRRRDAGLRTPARPLRARLRPMRCVPALAPFRRRADNRVAVSRPHGRDRQPQQEAGPGLQAAPARVSAGRRGVRARCERSVESWLARRRRPRGRPTLHTPHISQAEYCNPAL